MPMAQGGPEAIGDEAAPAPASARSGEGGAGGADTGGLTEAAVSSAEAAAVAGNIVTQERKEAATVYAKEDGQSDGTTIRITEDEADPLSNSDSYVFLQEEQAVEETAVAYVGIEDESGAVFELLIADTDGGLAVRAEDYYTRLSDMDARLTKREEEAAKKTAADQKAAADEALKFWDDELNLVYQAIRASMTDEEFDVLRTQEKAWLRSRDAAANAAAAAANQSNSAQSLAYTQSLVESTKMRVYELAELYYGE